MPTTRSLGDTGETAVATYLEQNGYNIRARNWRTRWCEIDIIASKAGRLYFIEVKARKNDNFGSGLDYITSKKQLQMQFAAELWVGIHRYEGNFSLAAASYLSTTGQIDFIELE